MDVSEYFSRIHIFWKKFQTYYRNNPFWQIILYIKIYKTTWFLPILFCTVVVVCENVEEAVPTSQTDMLCLVADPALLFRQVHRRCQCCSRSWLLLMSLVLYEKLLIRRTAYSMIPNYCRAYFPSKDWCPSQSVHPGNARSQFVCTGSIWFLNCAISSTVELLTYTSGRLPWCCKNNEKFTSAGGNRRFACSFKLKNSNSFSFEFYFLF